MRLANRAQDRIAPMNRCLPHLVLALAASASSSTGLSAQVQNQQIFAMHASGSFDVTITPQTDEGIGDKTVGRMSIDKQYHGDLEASGLGQMLAGMGATQKSGVSVAIERIRGTLNGRKGTFAVHHRGIMTRGAQDLVISVIPDSGTEDLSGITGTMTIDIKEGKHFYGFDYTLPQP